MWIRWLLLAGCRSLFFNEGCGSNFNLVLHIYTCTATVGIFFLFLFSLSVDGYSRAESVASSSSSCHEEQPGKLFVGSLAASVTEQDLYKYFSQFGEVKSCFIKFDLGTNKSRGFGFVVFRWDSLMDYDYGAFHFISRRLKMLAK